MVKQKCSGVQVLIIWDDMYYKYRILRILSKKKPLQESCKGFRIKILAMTYFHMRRPHTIIGAECFHF